MMERSCKAPMAKIESRYKSVATTLKKPCSVTELCCESTVDVRSGDYFEDDSQRGTDRHDGSVLIPSESKIFLANSVFKQNQSSRPPVVSSSSVSNRSSNLHLRKEHSTNSILNATKQVCNGNNANNKVTTISTSNSIYAVAQPNTTMVGGVLLDTVKLNMNSNCAVTENTSIRKPINPYVSSSKSFIDNLLSVDSKIPSFSETNTKKRILNDKENDCNPSESKKMATLEKQKLLAQSSKIDDLLNRKSIYAKAGEEEWFEGFSKRAGKLEDMEAKRYKAASYVNSPVNCFYCNECNLTTDSNVAYKLCMEKNHKVSVTRGLKWYFECGNCRKRDFTITATPSNQSNKNKINNNNNNSGTIHKDLNTILNSGITTNSSCFTGRQHPTRRCTCGTYDWHPCGKYGSVEACMGGGKVDQEHKVVLSATDWTSRKDLYTIASLKNNA